MPQEFQKGVISVPLAFMVCFPGHFAIQRHFYADECHKDAEMPERSRDARATKSDDTQKIGDDPY